jgi:ATP-binding cassette subfamily B protein
LRPLFRYLRPNRVQLIPVVLASALEMCFNAQIPMSVKLMIDRALLGHNAHMAIIILGALVASTVVVSVTSMGRDYLYAKVVSGIVFSLRQRMFEHLQDLSMDFFARNEVGDTMSRFSNDVAALENGLAAGVSWGLQPLMDLLLSAVLVFTLEWRLATLGILLCPVCVLGPRIFARRATEASVAKQEEESRIMSSLQETLMAPALVRAFNLQSSIIEKFREKNRLLLGAGIRLGFMTALMERSASFGTLVLQAVVMAISGYLAFRGAITIGTFAAFQALFVSLSYSFMYLAQYTPNLINASGGMIRIEEILRQQPKVSDAPQAAATSLAPPVEMRDVTFSYTGKAPNLDGVNLRIERGASVAFVGPSGCGKSTVLNLLLRFYDPDSGAILYNGADIRGATQASLRAQTAVVLQESFLFNTTVRENIALGRPDATDEEIADAARAAEIHELIMALPDGYNTMAGERGSRFSVGQRQRIAIARAVLKNPALLLLDEATSALDAVSETAINATLEKIARGRTTVSITHRLSSVVNMDCVYVLNRGRLMEKGPHRELLGAGALYAELWRKQAGLSIGAGNEKATVDAAWLAELPVMKGVHHETLAELAQWFSTEAIPEGRAIVQEGDRGNCFYILVRGSAEVTRQEGGKAGRTVRLAKLHDGDYFGEMALLSDEPRNATVRTLTACVCLSLMRDLFNRLLSREPELKEHFRIAAEARLAQAAQA